MNNCLITRLKESVNNSDLPRYGEIIINVNTDTSPNSQHLRFEVEGVNVDLDGHSMADETHLSKGCYDVKLYPKYDLTKFILGSGISVDFNDLSYCTKLKDIAIYYPQNKGYKNLSIFSQMTNLERLTLVNDEIIGDLSVLENIIPNIVTIDLGMSLITGDITLFKYAISLTNVLFINGNIHGELENIFEYWAFHRNIDSVCEVRTTNSSPNITLHGSTFVNSMNLYYKTTSTGCELLEHSTHNQIAQYNKTTNEWTYN